MVVDLRRGARTRSRVVWGSVSALLIFSFGYGFIATRQASTPAMQVRRLESELKCPSCVDVPVIDSNSASAFAIKDFIVKSVARKKSDTEIIDTLVTDYGNSILLVPPKSGLDILLWLTPLVVLGLLGFEGISRRRRPDTRAPRPDVLPSSTQAGAGPEPDSTDGVGGPQGRSPLYRMGLLAGAVLTITAGVGLLGFALLAGTTGTSGTVRKPPSMTSSLLRFFSDRICCVEITSSS